LSSLNINVAPYLTPINAKLDVGKYIYMSKELCNNNNNNNKGLLDNHGIPKLTILAVVGGPSKS